MVLVNFIVYFGNKFEQRPAQRHKKLGVVERKIAAIRLIVRDR